MKTTLPCGCWLMSEGSLVLAVRTCPACLRGLDATQLELYIDGMVSVSALDEDEEKLIK